MPRIIFSLSLLALFSGPLKSQTKENHYVIRFFNVPAESVSKVTDVLSRITGASSITYQPLDTAFSVSTSRLLDKHVISGKLLKHYFPVKFITHLETDIDPFPVWRNSGNMEADALQYEKEKQAWVKKYPEEYKKLLEKK
jgi:hypothetical protein